MSFSNKVVIVTGASSGIGESTAIMFSKEGADVIIVGRNDVKLKVVETQCKEIGNNPLKIIADISKENQAIATIDKTIEKFGKILGKISDGTIMNTYDELLNTNLRPVIHLTTLVTPHIIKTKGNIINVSSAGCLKLKNPSLLAYAISKSVLNTFNQGAAIELAPYGVRVNTISPGPVHNDIWENANLPLDALKGEDFKLPLNRVSKPEEITNLALYLASDKAVGITGSNYLADNGYALS